MHDTTHTTHGPPQHLVLHVPEHDGQHPLTTTQSVRWGRTFTPLVGIEEAPPACGGCFIHLDCTGCAHLFGGEAAMARRALDDLRRHTDCSDATAVLAPTPTAARTCLCARHVCDRGDDGLLCVTPDTLHDVLAPVTVAALVHDAAIVERLHEVGLDVIGQLIGERGRALRGACRTRYGPAFVQQIDAMVGAMLEPPPPDRPPPERCCATMQFDGPVRCTQTITLAVHQLLDEVLIQLHHMVRGVEELHVRVERPRQDDLVHTVRLTAPTRDAGHLRAVLQPVLERMDPGEDGAEALQVVAHRHVVMPHAQHAVWCDDGDQHEGPVAELVDVLRQRCTVARRFASDGHLPQVRSTPSRGMADADRPSRLFDRPVPVQVVLPTGDADGPGVLIWNRRRFVLVDARGPERITEPWWTHPQGRWRTRTYWRVQRADGQWLWVFAYAHAHDDTGLPPGQHPVQFPGQPPGQPPGRTAHHHAHGTWFLHGAWT